MMASPITKLLLVNAKQKCWQSMTGVYGSVIRICVQHIEIRKQCFEESPTEEEESLHCALSLRTLLSNELIFSSIVL